MANEQELLEPEVLPPEPEGQREARRPPPPSWGAGRGSMLWVGFLLDALDVLTFGPIGLRGGLIVGSIAGYFLLSSLQVPFRFRVPLAVLAGMYCAMPGTELLPLGTLLGLFWKRSSS